MDGAEFAGYSAKQAAITQCFDCCGYRARQDGFTTRFNRLQFSNTAVRTKYVCPEKSIFYDLDGSLTGDLMRDPEEMRPHQMVTRRYKFNDWEECDIPRHDSKMMHNFRVLIDW